MLELGCGTGRVLVPLAQSGFLTVGMDHDPAMLKFLQANMGTQYRVCADVSRRRHQAILPGDAISAHHPAMQHLQYPCVKTNGWLAWNAFVSI